MTQLLSWRGCAMAVNYTRHYWPSLADENVPAALIDVTTVDPARAPLPVTETGYCGHWTHPAMAAAEGGPVAYVQAWLDHAAQFGAWQERQAQGTQLSLL